MIPSCVVVGLAVLVGFAKAGRDKMALDDSNILFAARQWMVDPDFTQEQFGHIREWDTSNVTNMDWLFVNGPYGHHTAMWSDGSSSFNEDISGWDTSNVQSMSHTFYYCSEFDQDLSAWDVSKVTDMGGIFEEAHRFRGVGLERWNTTSVLDLSSSFQAASDFQGDLSTWDTSSVQLLGGTFRNARSFHADISNWDVSNVRDMTQTFSGATSFHANLNMWNVGNVQHMVNTFFRAKKFDQSVCWNLHPKVYLVNTFCGSKGASFNRHCVSQEKRWESVKDCHLFTSWTGQEIVLRGFEAGVVFMILFFVIGFSSGSFKLRRKRKNSKDANPNSGLLPTTIQTADGTVIPLLHVESV